MQSVELHIAADHPAYAGHFPAHPIFPGAALLDLALQTLQSFAQVEIEQWRLDGAKFQSALKPGEPARLLHESPAQGLIRFTILSNDRLIASGSLSRREPSR